MASINKRDRISKYFIDSTKFQIIHNGVESVSVRRIAEETGYSYATIYNYFTDLNALLWSVKKEMIHDFIEKLSHTIDGIEMNQVGIKQVFHLYVKYYFDHPNIYKFFYFYSVKSTEMNQEDPFDFANMWIKTFNLLMETHNLTIIDVQTISKTMLYTIQGILSLHFSQNSESTYESICQEIDEILDYLVQ